MRRATVGFYLSELFWCLRSIPWAFKKADPIVKGLEHWGILLAVVGLFMAVATFWFDYQDRIEERTVRAWQLLTTKAPGNSGKIQALEYLKQRAPLSGIDLSSKDVQAGAYLVGADLIGANLSEANLTKANLSGANLSGAKLFDAMLSGANFNGADLSFADVSGAILNGADLSFADLSMANLSGTSVSWANLIKANLSGANLRGANLSGADLSGADLTGAYLTGAYLTGTDVSGAYLTEAGNLQQVQVDDACGDESTNVPEEMTIPLCSEVDWYDDVHGDR